MNVGDSQLPTIVYASLEQPPQLSITAAEPDSIDANNGGTFYSVPALGEANTQQRYFTLSLSKGENITLKKVTVSLSGVGDLMDVVQQLPVPSGDDVQVVNENAQAVTAEKTVSGKRSLWRMADLLPGRYGSRDGGHDGWGARGTYNWFQQNAGLIKEVDDISGEHGRNLGHATHQFGTDIDTYHFYRFDGATSGTDNYNRLRDAVLTAFGTLQADGTPNPNPPPAATEAVNKLIAFVGATRTGLDNLAALNTVSRLYYVKGSAGSGLPNGWARALIETGRVTRTVNGVAQTLDLGTGNWSQAKVAYNSVHNNHVYVTLNRPAIGE